MVPVFSQANILGREQGMNSGRWKGYRNCFQRALWIIVFRIGLSTVSEVPGDKWSEDSTWNSAKLPFRSSDTGSSGYPGRFEHLGDEHQVVDDLIYNHWLIHAPSGR